MKLSPESRQRLATAAEQVYLAYTALDFFKSRSFTIAGQEKKLYDLCQQALQNKQLDQRIQIDETEYQLILSPSPEDNNRYTLSLSKVGDQPQAVLNKIRDYTDSQALDLLSNQQWTLTYQPEDGKLFVENRLNEEFVIGGFDLVEGQRIPKIDLYRTHLVTLYHMIERLNSEEEDLSNFLVALSTGSGKTYVQALWSLVLSLAQTNGVFALPDKLINQFIRDWKRILPESFVNSLLVLRDKNPDPQALQGLKDFQSAPAKSQILIGSNQCLLDEHYQDLMAADPEHTFLSFDEQHLMMQAERRRVRLIELSKQTPSMFLTATPSPETYALCGNKPVAIMSNGQKQEAGQGQFPELFSLEAKTVSDRHSYKDYRFWTREFWFTFLEKIILSITNAFQKEQSSSALTLIEELPFLHFDKKDEVSLRRRKQVLAARSMLCIVYDNETLVNLYQALEEDQPENIEVYHEGNMVDRSAVGNFFHLPNVERQILRRDLQHREQAYSDSLKEDEREISVLRRGQSSLKKLLKNTLFHNLLDYVLKDISGLDTLELNRLRKEDLAGLQQLILSRFSPKTAAYYEQKLAKDIDAEGAALLGEILNRFFQVFESYIFGPEEELTRLIDNWNLDSGLIADIKRNPLFSNHLFNEYAETHLIIGLMSGMAEAETPIAELKPFSGLNRHTYNLYEENGRLSPQAKARKHTALELLNDESRETSFTPQYLNFSEQIADKYFELDLVPMYVSNNKTEGFSKHGLHTVLNLANHRFDTNNDPTVLLQGFGRNRGLDETIVPAYVHSLGRKQETFFDLKNLLKEDYYPDLFAAQKKFNKAYVKVLGTKVGEEIIGWIHQNMDEDETINPELLKRQVLKRIALALRELNNKNHHKIKASKAQLRQMMHHAMKRINQDLSQLNKPYRLTPFLFFLGAVLNFICECYYSIKRFATDQKRRRYRRNRDQDAAANFSKHPDEVYLKVLRKTSYKKLVSAMAPANEFKNWLSRKSIGLQHHFEKNLTRWLTEEAQQRFNSYRQSLIIPFLLNLVQEDKREEVKEALNNFSDLPHYLNLQSALFQSLVSNEDQIESKTLSFLQKIPGLEHLALEHCRNPEIHNTKTLFLEGLAQVNNLDSFLFFFKSELCQNFLKTTFNPEDYELIRSCFATDEAIQALALKAFLMNRNGLSTDHLVQVFKEADPRLSGIEPLNVRFESFYQFFSNPTALCNPRALEEQTADFLTPVLFHKQFIATVNQFIGFLNQDDLSVILEAFDEPYPVSKAHQLLRFISLIRKQDKEGITREFISNPRTEFNLNELPLVQMIDLIYKIGAEVLDQHCYYHNQDNKGSYGQTRPKILPKLSAQLQQIYIPADDFLSGFSRKVFYIKGLINGLDKGSAVSKAANQHFAKTLKRVNRHLLNPLWWSTNLPEFLHGFIKHCAALYEALKTGFYSIINGFKAVGNWIAQRTYFKKSSKNEVSKEFNETAFDFSKAINHLKPMCSEEVIQEVCPIDTIEGLEQFIKERPTGLRFFDASLGRKPQVPVQPVEEEDVVYEPYRP